MVERPMNPISERAELEHAELEHAELVQFSRTAIPVKMELFRDERSGEITGALSLLDPTRIEPPPGKAMEVISI